MNLKMMKDYLKNSKSFYGEKKRKERKFKQKSDLAILMPWI